MVRLQRLEDLAAQVRNEASPHLACEPQAGLIVGRMTDSPSAEDALFHKGEGVVPHEHRYAKGRMDAAARRIQSDDRGRGQMPAQ